MRRLILVALVSAGAAASLAALDGRIDVFVQRPDGSPIDGVSIEVLDENDRVVLKDSVLEGRFKIEDLPFGMHSIVINRGKCSESRVRPIRFRPNSVDVYRIVLNYCYGSGDGMAVGCLIYLRAIDAKRASVPGAIIRSGLRGEYKMDRLGRAQLAVSADQDATYEISADGFETARISVSCRFPLLGLQEHFVKLEDRR